jgi:hypothetical protein
MQDFAAELRAAREPSVGENMVAEGQRAGGFESYLVSRAAQQGFDLGFEAGEKVAWDRARPQLEAVREQSRLDGFDQGVSVLLLQTLLGLQEVGQEFESRRAHKVMLERAKAKLMELVSNLESVASVMPPLHPEQQQFGMDAQSGMVG